MTVRERARHGGGFLRHAWGTDISEAPVLIWSLPAATGGENSKNLSRVDCDSGPHLWFWGKKHWHS